MSVDIADIAHKAADYIEKHGWTQGEYEREDGAVCLAGAISRVALGARVHDLDDLVPDSCVIQWQDRPGRTKDEVLALLRSVE